MYIKIEARATLTYKEARDEGVLKFHSIRGLKSLR